MPDNITFDVIGDKELAQRFGNAVLIRTKLMDAAKKSGVVVHQRASTYPSAPPASTYRRTRRFGNSWSMQVKPIGHDVQAIVDNPTDYGKYVRGTEDQAWMHVGRWATTKQILVEKTQQIKGFFEYAVIEIKRYLVS